MPEDWMKSDWVKVAAIAGGVGSSAYLVSQIQSYLPDSISAEIVGVGTGILVFLYGDRIHPILRYFGIGIIAGSLEPRIREMIAEATTKKAESSSGRSSNPYSLQQSYLARLR